MNTQANNRKAEDAISIPKSRNIFNKEIDHSCCVIPTGSPISSESDLSFSLSIDREIEQINCDEMPIFDVRLMSPLGRTPSPIKLEEDSSGDSSDNNNTPKKKNHHYHQQHSQQQSNVDESIQSSPCANNPEYVTLQEINAQISPPADDDTTINSSQNLETIFEGEIFSTPQRTTTNTSSHPNTVRLSRSHSLLERATMNRLMHGDKENYTPTSLFGELTPKRRQQYLTNAAKKLGSNNNDDKQLLANEN